MRVRIHLEVPTMYVDLTLAQVEAYRETNETWDWQPLIDALYDEFENHLMSEFTIEDVVEY